MIAKSDLVILVVSASALSAGIVRWQMNVAPEPVGRVAVPAVSAPARPATVPPAVVAAPVAAPDAPVSAVSTARVPPATAVAPATPSRSTGQGGRDGATVPASPVDPPASGAPLYGVHEVVGGDSLGAIARRFGTSVANLREINELQGTVILIGQRLRYPQAAN